MRALLFIRGIDAVVVGYYLEGAVPSKVEAFKKAGGWEDLQAWFNAGWKMVTATPHTSLNMTTLVVLERKRVE